MNTNLSHPVLDAIKKKAIETLPDGSKVMLFGSRARGDARQDSDWDLLVLVPGPEKIPFDEIWAYAYPFECIGDDYNTTIQTIVHTYSGWNKRWFLPLYHNIQKESIDLL